ncbi:MAG: ABC transporter ATP-binding protein [Planctomyces sp.]|nr:ABC transporter ATP-binding protein [Planctomyces sp.]
MLELMNVSKRFNDVTALEPTNLRFEAEKIYVLLGSSGCGKSTLLKLILGLLQPDTGEVRFDDTRLAESNSAQIRQQIGYVIQRGGLFPHLTAGQNVSIVARHLGWDRDRIQARIVELRKLTRLPAESMDRYPQQISGGQQQRVALMRALMLDPELLLLDEPLGALDPVIRSELQAELLSIFRELKKTVIVVTHDLNEAAFFADDVILMHSGAIIQRGSIDDLVNRPTDPFVTAFVTAQKSYLPQASS